MEYVDDVVPGMAEAIERRRVELDLQPGDFARAAGISAQGLYNVRKGTRRQYQDSVRFGVARALQWPNDALDRLLAGEDPATFETVPGTLGIEERLDRLEQLMVDLVDAVRKLSRQPGDEPG